MKRLIRFSAPLMLGASLVLPVAQASMLPPLLPVAAHAPYQADDLPPPTTRNGQEIFQRFRAGLAAPQCDADATSERWKRQFRHSTQRLADPDDPLLPLFGYVVDELHKAGLPSEFALIPFVESGYRPDARSKAGPTGLWQFIESTARAHKVPMGAGMDGRLSASESTAAAVKYLKTLHGIFDGRWELAVMGYNAGEYRILQALRRSGVNAGNASPKALAGLSPVTYTYVQKLHALSCVMEDAASHDGLMARLDREVPILTATTLSAGTAPAQWAAQQDVTMSSVLAFNPLLGRGKTGRALGVLAPAGNGLPAGPAPEVPVSSTANIAQLDTYTAADRLADSLASAPVPGADADALPAPAADAPLAAAVRSTSPRRHTVRNGESLWAIARRHGLPINALLALNNLDAGSVLRPGTVLRLDP